MTESLLNVALIERLDALRNQGFDLSQERVEAALRACVQFSTSTLTNCVISSMKHPNKGFFVYPANEIAGWTGPAPGLTRAAPLLVNSEATNLEAPLADALRKTRESLAGWMELQDEDDARSYDVEALEAADEALAAYDAQHAAAGTPQTDTVDTAALVRQLRERGMVVTVWSVGDVPDDVTDDPQAWLEEHRRDIENACVAAGNEVIEDRARASQRLQPR